MFDLTHLRYPGTMDWLWRHYMGLFFQRSLSRADRIVTISRFSAREIQEVYPKARGKVSITPLGPSAGFEPERDPEITHRALAAHGIVPPYFLFVGLLNPRKNIPRLIEAFSRFKETTALPHRLVLVGARGWSLGELEKSLQPLLLARDAILTGHVTDLAPLYHGAEALLMATLYEGFGLPIIEAMAYGCPVITSNCSSMPEVAGDAALLVDPRQVEEIAAAMERIARDGQLRRAMIERGFAPAAQFSFARMAAETARIYKEISAK